VRSRSADFFPELHYRVNAIVTRTHGWDDRFAHEGVDELAIALATPESPDAGKQRDRGVAKPLLRSWPRGKTKAIAGLAGYGKDQPSAVHARCSQRATPLSGRGNSGTCLCGPAVVH
jgi:hypothetical protein